MGHVPRNRQTEAAADHIAQKIEQDVVKIPIVKAQLFEQFEPVDNPASATAAPNLGPAQLHRKDTAALETDIADLYFLPRELFARRGFNDCRASLPAEQKRCGVGFRVAPDEKNAFALLGHHVAKVGQRERLADTPFAVDRDDLRFTRRFLGNDIGQVLMRLVTQTLVEIFQIWHFVFHRLSSPNPKSSSGRLDPRRPDDRRSGHLQVWRDV